MNLYYKSKFHWWYLTQPLYLNRNDRLSSRLSASLGDIEPPSLNGLKSMFCTCARADAPGGRPKNESPELTMMVPPPPPTRPPFGRSESNGSVPDPSFRLLSSKSSPNEPSESIEFVPSSGPKPSLGPPIPFGPRRSPLPLFGAPLLVSVLRPPPGCLGYSIPNSTTDGRGSKCVPGPVVSWIIRYPILAPAIYCMLRCTPL